MSRNKKIIQLIARLATAIFLFVLISPVSVYAQDSASDNDTDEEYQDWSDAFNDSEYTENLAENIARTWANYFVSYVGTREDVIDEVADYIGDSYDRTVSLYENLYTYILPYSRQTVMNIDGANLSIGTYGKPIRNKNNLKLINQYVKTMENSLPTEITDISTNKFKDGSDMTYADFPSFYHFADKPFNTSQITNFTGCTDNMMWAVGQTGHQDMKYNVIVPQSSGYNYVVYEVGYLNGADTRYFMIACSANNVGSRRYYYYASWESVNQSSSSIYNTN